MTSTELAHPYDLLTRRFMRDTELMADLLQYYPQKASDQKTVLLLDLTHLVCKSPVAIDENLVEGIGDLRFETMFRGSDRQSNVFLLFEHQSKIDRRIRLRGLDYINQSYKQFEEEHKGKKKLPYPIVVVLYHGRVPWEELFEMDDMIDMIEGAEAGLLRYTLILIDISVIPSKACKGHPALRALLEALQLGSEGKLAENFDRITDYFKPIKDDPRSGGWLRSLVIYAMSIVEISTELIVKAFSKVFNEREAQEMTMTTAQKLMLEGETRGEAKALLTVLRTKFKKIPEEIETVILAMSDSIALESLIAHATECKTLAEFAPALK